MYAQEPRSPGADSHVKRGRFSVTARYSASACRSCSRDRADSARVRSRSARPHIRPAATATSVASRSASANNPPFASVANHVETVTAATITSAITAAKMRRSEDRAGPDTGDVREPSSAVAMSQGDSVNSDSARSQRRALFLEGTSFRPERPFSFLYGETLRSSTRVSQRVGAGPLPMGIAQAATTENSS
jgi:hypothetical protein